MPTHQFGLRSVDVQHRDTTLFNMASTVMESQFHAEHQRECLSAADVNSRVIALHSFLRGREGPQGLQSLAASTT